MKAKKIHTRATVKTQEGKEIEEAVNALANAAEAGDTDAEQALRDLTGDMQKALAAVKAEARELNRSNRLALAEALNALLRLEQVSDSKTHLQEATSGLFRIIEEAQTRILKLTGAPGIISQQELQLFNRYGERITTRGEFWWKDLVARVQAGWRVEPGPWFMCQDRLGLNVGRGRRGAPHPERTPRQADPQTPSPETLQAWFDLPSEPRQAEGSPSES